MHPEDRQSVFIIVLESPGICRFINKTIFHHPTSSIPTHNKSHSVLLCFESWVFHFILHEKCSGWHLLQEQNPVSSMLNKCSGLNPFSLMSLLKISGYFSVAFVSADVASPWDFPIRS